MSYRASASIAVLLLAACAANRVSAEWEPAPQTVPDNEGGLMQEDAGASDGAPAIGPDSERPLVCGETGFCETRLPRSDLGEPLSLRSVWLVSSTDVWGVSAEGFVLHWDGATWTTVFRARHALSSVWASSTEVWVAGERGLVLHWTTGGEWTRIEPGHVEDIGGIYASDANDVWFGHESGADHFDGTGLATYPLPMSGLQFRAVFGRQGFGAYAVYANCADCKTAFTTRVYVFKLSPGEISEVNPELAKYQISPVAGVVTAAPDEDHRIFLVGYFRSFESEPWQYIYKYFGETSTLAGGASFGNSPFKTTTSPRTPIPSWANEGIDVRIQPAIGIQHRWESTASGFVLTPSIDMGHDFVPRTLFAVHGNETETWLVGDGFALKGPTP